MNMKAYPNKRYDHSRQCGGRQYIQLPHTELKTGRLTQVDRLKSDMPFFYYTQIEN